MSTKMTLVVLFCFISPLTYLHSDTASLYSIDQKLQVISAPIIELTGKMTFNYQQIYRNKLNSAENIIYRASQTDRAVRLDKWKMALELYEDIGHRRRKLLVIQNQGEDYILLGKIIYGLRKLYESLKIARELKDGAEESKILRAIGDVYASRAQPIKSAKYYAESLLAARATNARRQEAQALYTIANVRGNVHGLPYLQEALTIFRDIGDRAGEQHTLRSISESYFSMDKDDLGKQFHSQSIQLLMENIESRRVQEKEMDSRNKINIHPLEMFGIMNSSMQFNLYRSPLHMIQTFNRFPTIKRKSLFSNTNNSQIYTSYGYLGYINANEFIKIYQQQLMQNRKFHNKILEIENLINISNIYSIRNRCDKSLILYKQALSISKEINNAFRSLHAAYGIAQCYQSLGHFLDALSYYKEAIRLNEIIAAHRDTLGQIKLIEATQSIYQEIVSLLIDLHKKYPMDEYLTQAFEYVERSKAQTLYKQMSDKLIKPLQKKISRYRKEEIKLRTRLDEATDKLKYTQDEEERKEIFYNIANIDRYLDDVVTKQQLLRKQNIITLQDENYSPVSLIQLQTEILKEGEILLEYFWGKDSLYLFVINRWNIRFFEIAEFGEEYIKNNIIRTIRPLYKMTLELQNLNKHTKQSSKPVEPKAVYRIIRPILDEFDPYYAFTLYEELIKPAETYIKNATTVMIVPDGMLHMLPFELLVTHNPRNTFDYREISYLIQQFPISYAPSASVLRSSLFYRAGQHGTPSKTLLALAPFGENSTTNTGSMMDSILTQLAVRSSSGNTTFLPGSTQEVRRIAEFEPNADIFIGDDITKDRVFELAKNYKIVHIAGHAKANFDNGLNSSILLAEGESIQAYEIFDLDLRAELVVLSACETGLGQLEKGEGFIGLTRAFLLAGTPSVVSTLWDVSDASTPTLMQHFYQYLRSGMTKAEALQQAKLSLMNYTDKSTHISFSHPAFWAPFILHGM